MRTVSLTSVVLVFSFAQTARATCFRPQDMSNVKAVDFYVACKKKIEAVCEKNGKIKDCASLKKPLDYQKRFPVNVGDIDPQARCTIYRDGSYKCLQDPVRFVAKQRTNDAPIALPTPSSETLEVSPAATPVSPPVAPPMVLPAAPPGLAPVVPHAAPPAVPPISGAPAPNQ